MANGENRDNMDRVEIERRLARVASACSVNMAVQATPEGWRLVAHAPASGERWSVQAACLADAASELEQQLQMRVG